MAPDSADAEDVDRADVPAFRDALGDARAVPSDLASADTLDAAATDGVEAGMPDLVSRADSSVARMDVGFLGLAVWGSSTNDIWVGGKGGVLLHWDGKTWSDHPFFGSNCLVVAIWGSSSDSVWAVGCTNTIAHWDGKSWQAQPTSAGTRLLETLRGTAWDDVWAGGCNLLLRWDGITWSETSSGTSECVEGFWFRARSDGWFVNIRGSASGVSHWDGQRWSPLDMTGIGEGRPTAIFASSPDDIWVSTWHGLYRYDGATWGAPAAGKDIGNDRRSVFNLWGRSGSDLFAGSANGWHFDGKSWSAVTPDLGTIRGIWGEPAGETWLVGDDGFLDRIP